MARYNDHKRATLDRLTLSFQLQARSVVREDLSRLEVDIVEALAAGRMSFAPKPSAEATRRLEAIYAEHQKKVIYVGFSDGIQEVSPESKPQLGLWQSFPIGMPIENTLKPALAESRNRWAEDFIRKQQKALKERLAAYVKTAKSDYLKNLRQSWALASKRWLAGEQDVGDVREILKAALRKTDSSAERILRTETTSYFNESRCTYFKTQTAVDFMQIYAVTDGRISHICEARHGFVVPIEKASEKKYMPAFHPHCRTVQRALFSSLPSHKQLIDKGLAMNEAAFPPLPAGWV